jgi:hypothetical protein
MLGYAGSFSGLFVKSTAAQGVQSTYSATRAPDSVNPEQNNLRQDNRKKWSVAAAADHFLP